jgi:hypothetical protein
MFVQDGYPHRASLCVAYLHSSSSLSHSVLAAREGGQRNCIFPPLLTFPLHPKAETITRSGLIY